MLDYLVAVWTVERCRAAGALLAAGATLIAGERSAAPIGGNWRGRAGVGEAFEQQHTRAFGPANAVGFGGDRTPTYLELDKPE